MGTWFSKELGDGMAANGPSRKILDAFKHMFIAAGQPQDFAVFSRYDQHANMVTVYFSPAAAQFAKAFDAVPCEKPSSQGIGLLVGPQDALFNLFPDGNSQRGE